MSTHPPICVATTAIAKFFTATTDESLPECQICCEPIVCVAIGKCVDRMCWVCALRLRRLHNNKSCPFCCNECAIVVLALQSDERKNLDDFDLSKWPAHLKDETADMYYASEEIADVAKSLCAIKCWLCSSAVTFATESALQQHLVSIHKRKLCSVCLSGRSGTFLIEQFLFDPKDIARHRQIGDPKLRPPMPAHPRCRWDGTLCFDENAYQQHLTRQHFVCDLCHINSAAMSAQVLVTNGASLSPVFADVEGLVNHYAASHFPCPYPQCNMEVFPTAVELHYHLTRKHGEGPQKSSRFKMSLQELAQLAGISSPAEYSTAPLAANRQRRRPNRRGPNSQPPSEPPSRPTTESVPSNLVDDDAAFVPTNPLLSAAKEIASGVLPRLWQYATPPQDAQQRFVQGFRAHLDSSVIREFVALRESLLTHPPLDAALATTILLDTVWILWGKNTKEAEKPSQSSWKKETDLSVSGELLFLNVVTVQEARATLIGVLEDWQRVASEETKVLEELGIVIRKGLLPALADAVSRALKSRAEGGVRLADRERTKLDRLVASAYIDKGVDPSGCLMMKSHLTNLVSEPHLEALDTLKPSCKRLANLADTQEVSRTWQLDCRRVFRSWSVEDLSSVDYYLSQCRRAVSILEKGPKTHGASDFPELPENRPFALHPKSEWRRPGMSQTPDEFPPLASSATPAPSSGGWGRSPPRVHAPTPPATTTTTTARRDVPRHDDFPPLSGVEPRRYEPNWGPGAEPRRKCHNCHYFNDASSYRCGMCSRKF